MEWFHIGSSLASLGRLLIDCMHWKCLTACAFVSFELAGCSFGDICTCVRCAFVSFELAG